VINQYVAYLIYPTIGELGKDLEVTLTGRGFDSKTRVSVYLDSGNKKAIIGAVDTPDHVQSVTVVGATAYVSDGSGGLQVIDVSTPTNPLVIGSVGIPGGAVEVAVAEGKA
jgi:hypothetical protein